MRRFAMALRAVAATLGLLLLPIGAVGAAPAIDHKPVTCAVAEKFPRLEARLDPAPSISRAVIQFRTESTPRWYAVAMKAEHGSFFGVLPRPRKSLKAFRYYIEATDDAFATSRTPEYSTSVVPGAGDCQGKVVAGALGSASVLLQVPAGAAAVPAGFASTGVVTAGSGTAASAAGAASGGGGGFPTGLVLGAVGVAGAAGAAVAITSGKDGPKHLEIHGEVFATLASGPTPGVGVDPVAGAIVSTSLDGTTATTNGSGRFDLVTQSPEGDECTVYTITIVAAGHPTYSVTAPWGRSLGTGKPITFSLSPVFPSVTAIVKPQCPAR
jgi:hypothetical protein